MSEVRTFLEIRGEEGGSMCVVKCKWDSGEFRGMGEAGDVVTPGTRVKLVAYIVRMKRIKFEHRLTFYSPKPMAVAELRAGNLVWGRFPFATVHERRESCVFDGADGRRGERACGHLRERGADMKIFLDTEFLERGRFKPVTLISLALVAEDGREYYAESNEFDVVDATPWLKEHVVPHLSGPAKQVAQIANEVRAFCGPGKPEFWGYYCDYDWVVFCQIFGSMVDLPAGWPMYCRDIKQWCDSIGNPRLPQQEKGEHHALKDARWNMLAWLFLQTALMRGVIPRGQASPL